MMNREIISVSVVLGMRNVSDGSCRENQNTFYVSKRFSSKKSLWDIVVQYCRAGQGSADNMARAHCVLITKASDTHSEYVVLTAVSLQKWLYERV